MSNEFPYSNINMGGEYTIKLPQKLDSVSEIKDTILEETPEKMVKISEYPYGLKLKITQTSGQIIIESNKPIIEKDGVLTFDMSK